MTQCWRNGLTLTREEFTFTAQTLGCCTSGSAATPRSKILLTLEWAGERKVFCRCGRKMRIYASPECLDEKVPCRFTFSFKNYLFEVVVHFSSHKTSSKWQRDGDADFLLLANFICFSKVPCLSLVFSETRTNVPQASRSIISVYLRCDKMLSKNSRRRN